MKKSNFESLRVYKLSEDLADAVWRIVSSWNQFNRNTIGSQLVRSADSIGANIAEGTGRYGAADQKRFMYIARGSLNETRHWLRRAFVRELLSREEVELLARSLDELAPKLNAYINSINKETFSRTKPQGS